MIVINIDQDFMPYKAGVEMKHILFPSGFEGHCVLPSDFPEEKEVLITCRVQSGYDIMLLLQVTDAVRRFDLDIEREISVYIPYLPYARQDRVMTIGEPFSLKVFADLINSQKYKKVMLFDPHSEVAAALINNAKVEDNMWLVDYVLTTIRKDTNPFFIVSPDAGAAKKIFKSCRNMPHWAEIVLCNKHRDVTTGEIKSTHVPKEDFEGKDCYIIDDICDGGGTFILLAQELKKRNAGRIYLIVSHGIFSKGLDVFTDFEHIYCTDSFKDHLSHEKLTQITL